MVRENYHLTMSWSVIFMQYMQHVMYMKKFDAQMLRVLLLTILFPIHQHTFKLQIVFFFFGLHTVEPRLHCVLCMIMKPNLKYWLILFVKTLWCSTKYWRMRKVFPLIILPRILKSPCVFCPLAPLEIQKVPSPKIMKLYTFQWKM